MKAEKLLRDDMEYIIHCEPDGKIIGPISKVHAHLPGPRAELCHYSTYSMIFHLDSGKYGIQRKNPKKHDKQNAGKWDMGVAGHNCYVKDGSAYRSLDFGENLVKEAEEEIGLDLQMFDSENDFLKASENIMNKAIGVIIDRFHYKTERDNEFVGLAFVIVPDMNVEFKDGEVVDFKWLTPEELAKFLKDNDNYCLPLPIVFEKAEKFRLKYLGDKK
jgi:isopentenyldiphosphate isomerase